MWMRIRVRSPVRLGMVGPFGVFTTEAQRHREHILIVCCVYLRTSVSLW
jgi:hypothetical protein